DDRVAGPGQQAADAEENPLSTVFRLPGNKRAKTVPGTSSEAPTGCPLSWRLGSTRTGPSEGSTEGDLYRWARFAQPKLMVRERRLREAERQLNQLLADLHAD